MSEKPKYIKIKTITLREPMLGLNGFEKRKLEVIESTVDDPIQSILGPTGPQGIQGIQGVKGSTGATGADGNPNMILTSPNGWTWQVSVDNNGILHTTNIHGQGSGGATASGGGAAI